MCVDVPTIRRDVHRKNVEALIAAACFSTVPRGIRWRDVEEDGMSAPLVRRHHVDLCRTSTAVCPA
jgi:1,6-anhydro-N-acetylmuramate kinase